MTVAIQPKKYRLAVRTEMGDKASLMEELPHECPSFRRAFIATDRGTAGIMWREVGGDHAPFQHGATDGLLSRISLPGDSETSLRRKLCPPAGTVTEVFLPSASMCRTDQVPVWVGALVEMLQEAFCADIRVADFREPGERWRAWEPYLDFSGMRPFQRKVLGIVGRIDRGKTMTYGEVARLAGNPHGARAVGMVMRTNPWPILVPCHRVVGSTGKMTGFSAPGGVETKRRLLTREKALLF